MNLSKVITTLTTVGTSRGAGTSTLTTMMEHYELHRTEMKITENDYRPFHQQTERKLKICPFCGGQPIVERAMQIGPNWWQVRCPCCNAKTDFHISPDCAMYAWKTDDMKAVVSARDLQAIRAWSPND